MGRIAQLDSYLAPGTSVPALGDALRDQHWEVRAIAIHTLGASGGADLASFETALGDEHPAVRAAAVRAIGRLTPHAPLDSLALALRDADAEVRAAVAEVLGELGTLDAQPVRPLLALALHDTHESVRTEARLALLRCDGAAADISVTAAEPVPQLDARRVAARHAWQVFLGQPGILQRNWPPVVGLLFLCDALVLVAALWLGRNLHDTSNVLALVTTVAAAVGIAFAANLRHDAGLELTLSTPTSARMLLFCRFALVIGSTILLSGAASAAIALVYGHGFWGIVQLWLGPVLLASSFTLALVMLAGSWLSVLVTSALEAVQTLRLAPDHQLYVRDHAFLLQTNPLVVGLALLCLAFAFLYIPRQHALTHQVTELW